MTPLQEFGVENKGKISPTSNYNEDLLLLIEQYERIDNKLNLLMIQIDKFQDGIDEIYSLAKDRGEAR